MKFLIRLVLATVVALALSMIVVTADEEPPMGQFVQVANEFTLQLVEDNTYTLTLRGVPLTTPIAGALTGGIPTADLLSDWFAVATALPATVRFQFGNPDRELYDVTLVGAIAPAEVTDFATPREYDGVAVYTFTIAQDGFLGFEITGTSPGTTKVEELTVKEITDDLLGEAFASDDQLLYVSLYVSFDDAFVEALAQARIERLSGARPSSTGGSCLPKFTCK